MSDYIPLDIQVQILNRLPVKSLLQSRSVSKTWKNLIDSPHFITSYSAQGTQVQHLLVNLQSVGFDKEDKYYLITEDDSFPQHKVSVPVADKFVAYLNISGCSHGLLCYIGYYLETGHIFPTCKAVIWNPSIRKVVAAIVPNARDEMYGCSFGFGVFHGDPKIVKIRYFEKWEDIESISHVPQQVEVFMLSRRGWRSSNNNLPRKTIQFNDCQRVEEVDGFLYWLATDRIAIDGGFRCYNLIVSFDLTSEQFSEVKIPDSLANEKDLDRLSMYKVRESLVVVHEWGASTDHQISVVWMMKDGFPKSFTVLFTINTTDAFIRGFRKSGEPVIEIEEEEDDPGLLYVIDPHSEQIQIDDLGIIEARFTYRLFHYIETLILLDHPNLVVYNDI